MSLLYYQHDLSEIQGNFPDNPAIVLYGETIFPLGCSDGPVFLKSFEHFKNILIDSDDVDMHLMIPAPGWGGIANHFFQAVKKMFAAKGSDCETIIESLERIADIIVDSLAKTSGSLFPVRSLLSANSHLDEH